MAQKKAGNASLGLILTLVFFILATFVTGTVAYFGYAEVKQRETEAKKAQDEKNTMEKKWREERVRKVLLRIAMGIEAPSKIENESDNDSDRQLLVSEMDAFRPQILDEYDRMRRTLDDKLPDKNSFQWRLLSMSSGDLGAKTGNADPKTAGTDPDVAPIKTLPQMLQAYKDETKKARDAQKLAEDKAIAAENLAKQKTVAADTSKMIFDQALEKVQADLKEKYGKMDVDFKGLVDKQLKDGKAAADLAKTQGDAINTQEDELTKQKNKITDQDKKITKLEHQLGTDLNVVGIDFVNLEEKKGEIVRKEGGGFVTVNIGSSKKLKPQITFLVVRSDVSWLALLEKEESLKRNTGRLDRQPFEDNPFVKAGIEIVEVTGPETSRAKVLFENEPIRNPIQPRDQIFNLAWQPNEEIRIAFAGIIDLDGDGLDNNDDFLRLLERQGVIVDEYLKLKPLELVKRDGKGMTLQTKYLVIAPDPRLDDVPLGKTTSPQAEQIQKAIAAMSEMKARARALGIQMIESHKFLALIGYKLPKNPAPPSYGASVYLDTQVAPPPKDPR